MHNKFKELADQAGANTDTSGRWVNSNGFEKFAELIVREMLATCEEHPAWTGRMIGEQIKQHFGVK